MGIFCRQGKENGMLIALLIFGLMHRQFMVDRRTVKRRLLHSIDSRGIICRWSVMIRLKWRRKRGEQCWHRRRRWEPLVESVSIIGSMVGMSVRCWCVVSRRIIMILCVRCTQLFTWTMKRSYSLFCVWKPRRRIEWNDESTSSSRLSRFKK